jgi:hypothetical protein
MCVIVLGRAHLPRDFFFYKNDFFLCTSDAGGRTKCASFHNWSMSTMSKHNVICQAWIKPSSFGAREHHFGSMRPRPRRGGRARLSQVI